MSSRTIGLPDRRQRRRQDHADAVPRRPASPQRGRITVDGRDITARRRRGTSFGVTLVPEGRRVFAPMTVRENLEMGAFRRLWPRRDRAVAGDIDDGVRPVPAARRAAEAGGRPAVGWRAADARDRAGADVAATAAAARRAVDGPGAPGGAGNLRDHRQTQRGRHVDTAGRAERQHGAATATVATFSRMAKSCAAPRAVFVDDPVVRSSYLRL